MLRWYASGLRFVFPLFWAALTGNRERIDELGAEIDNYHADRP